MNWLIAFVTIALIFQIALFFIIRNKKRKDKENSVIERYNIKSAREAFNLLNNSDIPDADRKEIERLYKGEDS